MATLAMTESDIEILPYTLLVLTDIITPVRVLFYTILTAFASFLKHLLKIRLILPLIILENYLLNILTFKQALCYTLISSEKEVKTMATNPPKGDGHRNGAVRHRSQTFNPVTQQWVKRDTDTGRFMDVKQDGTPFKGVRKEN